tara:strand:- start:277 stop:507 length:231 start_codon:yes stop_codon:yes gene_type:complete
MDKKSEKKVESLSFEESFERLKEIVELLDNENVSLDDSINYYEEGMKLKNHCEMKLKNAEVKIKKVIQSNSDENSE